jgi:hypothetical protein
MPKMLLNQGGMGGWMSSPSPEDMLPIGKWKDMAPDSHGLQSKGRLINLDTETGKRVYGAMKEGELSDLSIGYIARDFVRGTKPNEPRRSGCRAAIPSRRSRSSKACSSAMLGNRTPC